MKIYPYQTPGGVIELVEKREYDAELSKLYDLLRVANQTSATMDLKAIKLEQANAELIQRLAEARESHLHASARDVQTIQRQSVLWRKCST